MTFLNNTKSINDLRQFRQELEPHGIQIWNSPEKIPEEIPVQLVQSDEEKTSETANAEEIHPQQQITTLPDDTAPLHITHFIDGSPRTINVGFLLAENGVSYPVALSHVGAASVTFKEGNWKQTGYREKHLLLASLNTAMGLTDITYDGTWILEDPLDKIRSSKPLDMTDSIEMRAAAVRRARRRMRNCEKELALELAGKYPQEWIALDGTLFEVEGHSDLQNINVIGISKSFTLNPIVLRNGVPQRTGSLIGTLTKLPVGFRSSIYRLTPEKGRPDKYTYMWFIRLHPPRHGPVSGVIKVELPPSETYGDDNADFREQTINAISHTLFRMRNPYLYDNRRGESFLYPIYVAENAIKSKLSSLEKIRGLWESSQY